MVALKIIQNEFYEQFQIITALKKCICAPSSINMFVIKNAEFQSKILKQLVYFSTKLQLNFRFTKNFYLTKHHFAEKYNYINS